MNDKLLFKHQPNFRFDNYFYEEIKGLTVPKSGFQDSIIER